MRTLFKVVASLALGVGVVGILHMPFTRGFLQSVGGCPFPSAGRTLAPAEAEALRVATLQRAKGQQGVAQREAAGFRLGKDGRREISAWAALQKLACKPDRHGAGLRCASVSGSMLPLPRRTETAFSVMFAFDADDRLVGVQLQSQAAKLENAVADATLASRAITSAGGPALANVEQLVRPLGQARTGLRGSNYVADLVVTHVGDHYALYESYQTL